MTQKRLRAIEMKEIFLHSIKVDFSFAELTTFNINLHRVNVKEELIIVCGRGGGNRMSSRLKLISSLWEKFFRLIN